MTHTHAIVFTVYHGQTINGMTDRPIMINTVIGTRFSFVAAKSVDGLHEQIKIAQENWQNQEDKGNTVLVTSIAKI